MIFCVKDSLFFDLVCGGSSHMPCVCLCFAAVPQVDEGFVDVQKDHWCARSQTAAVTCHFQQVALNGYLTTCTIQTPIICNRVKQKNINMLVYSLYSILCILIIIIIIIETDKKYCIVFTWAHYIHAKKVYMGKKTTLTVWINMMKKIIASLSHITWRKSRALHCGILCATLCALVIFGHFW